MREKAERIDLGLALLSIHAMAGEPLTWEDVAAWCDCHPEAIRQIERKALQKVRYRLKRLGVDGPDLGIEKPRSEGPGA